MNREAAVKNTFNVRVVGVSVTVAALLIGLAGCRAFRANSDSEDRSRIIVRSGSIDFEQDVDWEFDGGTDKKKASPKQPNGANVTGFQVTFAKQDIEGTSCPQVPVVGDSVDFAYTPASGPVTLSAKLLGGRNAPMITAPGDMTIDNAGSKKKLTFGPTGDGSIASVTVKYGPATQKCTPNGGKFTKEIEIKPLR